MSNAGSRVVRIINVTSGLPNACRQFERQVDFRPQVDLRALQPDRPHDADDDAIAVGDDRGPDRIAAPK